MCAHAVPLVALWSTQTRSDVASAAKAKLRKRLPEKPTSVNDRIMIGGGGGHNAPMKLRGERGCGSQGRGSMLVTRAGACGEAKKRTVLNDP